MQNVREMSEQMHQDKAYRRGHHKIRVPTVPMIGFVTRGERQIAEEGGIP